MTAKDCDQGLGQVQRMDGMGERAIDEAAAGTEPGELLSADGSETVAGDPVTANAQDDQLLPGLLHVFQTRREAETELTCGIRQAVVDIIDRFLHKYGLL